jgi:hypothetical protein
VGTVLFMKCSILLMKFGDVKTQKQNFLFFIRYPLILRRNFAVAILQILSFSYLPFSILAEPSSLPLSVSQTFHGLMEIRPLLTFFIGQTYQAAEKLSLCSNPTVIIQVALTHERLAGCSKRPDISPAHPLADIFHQPYPQNASQSISRDVPFARARSFWFSPLRPQGSSQTVLHCAHRTKALQFSLLLSKGVPRLPSTARIKRYICSLQACSILSRDGG